MISILLAAVLQRGAQPLAPVVLDMELTSGSIRVYLPARLHAGEHISGSAFASPCGDDWDTQHKNLEYLDSLTVNIGTTTCRVGDAVFETDVPDATSLRASICDSDGRILGSVESSISSVDSTFEETQIAQEGTPIGVVGDFDGRRANTSAQVDGRPVGILAESSNECFVTAPSDSEGPIHLRVQEGKKIVNSRLNIVRLSFLAPAKPTASGQRSSIGVEVSGLEGLVPNRFPVAVDLTIDRPEIASFLGPAPGSYRLEIRQQDVTDGNVLKSVPIVAKSGGSYLVRAEIEAEGS